MKLENEIESLNNSQKKAVEWSGGNLLVLAGPGSGKTRVLTIRIASLIHNFPDKRFRVLGLTFTSKAASEMRERTKNLIPPSYEKRFSLSTFHSFSTDILRQHGSHIGLEPDFNILTQDEDRVAFIEDCISDLLKGNEAELLSASKLLPLIDRLLANCVEDHEIEKWVYDQDSKRSVTEIFKCYKLKLIKNNKLDFASILYFTEQLLRTKKRISKQLSIVYPFVCIDEFQDTNLAQYKILELLMDKESSKLFVVADDDQIIYQWNGANPERLEALKSDFSMTTIQLPENYRCPPEIINLANHLITYNLNRSPEKKPLKPIRPRGGRETIKLEALSSPEEESIWIANDIKSKHRQNLDDVVVLGRTRKLIETVANELRKININPYMIEKKNEFESVPMRFLHTILRLANTRGDKEQVRRLCKSYFELTGTEILVDDVIVLGKSEGGDFLRFWFQLAKEKEKENSRQEVLDYLKRGEKSLVNRMDYKKFMGESFSWFQTSLLKAAVEDLGDDFNGEKEIWFSVQNEIDRKFEGDELSLYVMLQEMDLSPKSSPPPNNSLRCFTIHNSKGLEFKHVYLMGLAEDILPSFFSLKKGDNSREVQEERRNCFVGITRTQETLVLTYSKSYYGYPKQPSRFLSEMGLSSFPKQSGKSELFGQKR